MGMGWGGAVLGYGSACNVQECVLDGALWMHDKQNQVSEIQKYFRYTCMRFLLNSICEFQGLQNVYFGIKNIKNVYLSYVFF